MSHCIGSDGRRGEHEIGVKEVWTGISENYTTKSAKAYSSKRTQK